MDKKKVKENLNKIQRTLDSLRGYNDRINKLVLVLDDCVESAQKELSKSDWVSVENELPPIGEAVRVRSKQHPNDFMLACRIDENTMKTIYPHKYYSCDVTHWKPIEKLEE